MYREPSPVVRAPERVSGHWIVRLRRLVIVRLWSWGRPKKYQCVQCGRRRYPRNFALPPYDYPAICVDCYDNIFMTFGQRAEYARLRRVK